MNHFDILGVFLHFKTKIEILIRYFHIKSPFSSRVWKNAIQKKLLIWALFKKCRLTLSVERQPKILLKSCLQCSHPKIYKVYLIIFQKMCMKGLSSSPARTSGMVTEYSNQIRQTGPQLAISIILSFP